MNPIIFGSGTYSVSKLSVFEKNSMVNFGCNYRVISLSLILKIFIFLACTDEFNRMIGDLPSFIDTANDLVYNEEKFVDGTVFYSCPANRSVPGTLASNITSVCTIRNPDTRHSAYQFAYVPKLVSCSGNFI